MTDTFRIGAVILAGGRGSRMHSGIQKQYMLLDGRPLIAYALEAFERSCADDLVLVTGAGEAEFVQKEILPSLGLTKLRSIVTGGKERYHSVYEGLKAKFSQNAELKRQLVDTGDAVLAECAVRDQIWGIGLSMGDPNRFERSKWKGNNLLGYALMLVREQL